MAPTSYSPLVVRHPELQLSFAQYVYVNSQSDTYHALVDQLLIDLERLAHFQQQIMAYDSDPTSHSVSLATPPDQFANPNRIPQGKDYDHQ